MEDFVSSWWPIILSFILSTIVVIRTYIAGPNYSNVGDISEKVVMITGASGGLGLVTAKQLISRGGHVIMVCRNEIKGKKAVEDIKRLYPNAKVDLKLLDISMLSNIHKFVEQIQEEYTKIDVLINNAGIVFHPYEKTSEGFELTMATNYFGPFTLTHLLLPLLNKSDNGRVINITAVAHFSAILDVDDLNGNKELKEREVFGQTKLGLLLFTRHLAKLLNATKITVNAVNPGLVRNTEHLRNSTMQTSIPTKISVWPWMWLFMKTPKQGSQTIIYSAIDSNLEHISGKYLSDCQVKEPSRTACNDELAKKLYENTCKICKIDIMDLQSHLIIDSINVQEQKGK